MFGRLIRRRLFVGGAFALVVLPLLWWFAWMAPQGAHLASARATARADQLQKSNLTAELAQLVREEKQVRAASPFQRSFAAAIPQGVDPAGLVVQVYNLSRAAGVTLEGITDDTVSAASKRYSSIPVSISVTGGHAAVNAFISGLYHLPRLLTVQTLNLSGPGALNVPGGGGQYNASISATAYTTETGIDNAKAGGA